MSTVAPVRVDGVGGAARQDSRPEGPRLEPDPPVAESACPFTTLDQNLPTWVVMVTRGTKGDGVRCHGPHSICTLGGQIFASPAAGPAADLDVAGMPTIWASPTSTPRGATSSRTPNGR